jgi:L-ornithine N5-oxygenase
VLAIGAGPSNLALAVALEELAPDDLATSTLLIERNESVAWQPGMLLPSARSQVSFLKDLVTLRNPRSEFSFLNYLHSVGRLDAFTNMGSFLPYRIEISEYLRWVAASLSKVRVALGVGCTSIEPCWDGQGVLAGWITHLSDGLSIQSRYLVFGGGRDPYVPPVFGQLPQSRVIHSTRFRTSVAELSKGHPYRVLVVGSAQSAAEMVHALHDDLPQCDLTWVMRSIGATAYEHSKFTNELYYPSFVDEFFVARPEAREQMLREMHRTNYSGVALDLLESLYSGFYLDRLTGQNRRRIITMADVTGAREVDGEVVVDLHDRKTGCKEEVRCDLVFLGTGFVREMPSGVRHLADAIGLERIEVTRKYRLIVDRPASAACYLQGVNEATHGIADSLLSVLAHRAADIVEDLIAHRSMTRNGDGARSRLAPLRAAVARRHPVPAQVRSGGDSRMVS